MVYKIDVGFASNKVSLKDAFVQKKWGNNNFRIGYMLGMCCIEQSASTNDYVFMTGANAAETFYLGRRVGVSYTFRRINIIVRPDSFAEMERNMMIRYYPVTMQPCVECFVR